MPPPPNLTPHEGHGCFDQDEKTACQWACKWAGIFTPSPQTCLPQDVLVQSQASNSCPAITKGLRINPYPGKLAPLPP
jgi:hypothetical protein